MADPRTNSVTNNASADLLMVFIAALPPQASLQQQLV
jgi:hypothetical protein